jgi:2-iminobutanoate/2-iminopropanoate deaminase
MTHGRSCARGLPLFVLAGSLAGARLVHAQQPQPAPTKTVIGRPGARPGVLSPAVRVGDLLFLSGVTGNKPGGGLADGGIEGQTRQALENVKSTLALAGATMADVAKCTVFLTDASSFAAMNQVYREFFPTDPPARSTVVVAALVAPNALIEIECTAAAPSK